MKFKMIFLRKMFIIFDSIEFGLADPWDNLRDVYCALSSPEKNSFNKVQWYNTFDLCYVVILVIGRWSSLCDSTRNVISLY